MKTLFKFQKVLYLPNILLISIKIKLNGYLKSLGLGGAGAGGGGGGAGPKEKIVRRYFHRKVSKQ